MAEHKAKLEKAKADGVELSAQELRPPPSPWGRNT